MKLFKRLSLIIFIGFIPFNGFSQDGSPDLTFGTGGVVETDINGGWDYVWKIAQQSDGKLLIAGAAEFTLGFYPILVRYLNDGTKDSSFGAGGIVWKDYGSGSNADYNEIYFQNPDKIIAGTRYGGSGGYRLTRFFDNGTIDNSFGLNGDLNITPSDGAIRDLKFLDDGKFVVLGQNNDSPSEITLLRYLQNGDLDTSFGINGEITILVGEENNLASQLIISQNGNFIILGKTTSLGEQQNFLIRLLSDGELNLSFGVNGVVDLQNTHGCSFKLYHDEKILVKCGYFDANDVYTGLFKRYLQDGILDTTFGNSGQASIGLGAYLIQENERIVMYRVPQNPFEGGGYLMMYRLHSSGLFQDSSFQYSINYSELESAHAIFQNDGKIVVAGSSMWYNGPVDFVLQRFHNSPLNVTDFTINNIKVFPNPSSGIFNISHDFIASETAYHIIDITGKIIQRGAFSGKQTKVDLSTVQKGIYLLQVSGTTMKLVRK